MDNSYCVDIAMIKLINFVNAKETLYFLYKPLIYMNIYRNLKLCISTTGCYCKFSTMMFGVQRKSMFMSIRTEYNIYI